jgi:hypothetical protein
MEFRTVGLSAPLGSARTTIVDNSESIHGSAALSLMKGAAVQNAHSPEALVSAAAWLGPILRWPLGSIESVYSFGT